VQPNSNTSLRPVSIVGAGPSGLAAAITLARAGRKAIVYERQPDAGCRFHGDFQGLENWSAETDVLDELGSLGIEPSFDYAPCREGRFFDPAGREMRLKAARPALYLVRRGREAGTLDQSLKQQALAAGVEIRFRQTCPPLTEGGIVASGPRTFNAIDVGYVFETAMPDGVFAVFSDRIAPKGYAYLLVSRGRGTVASCLFADFANEKWYLERTVEFFVRHAGLCMTTPRRFGGTGNVVYDRSARDGGCLRVGEAAGFQDALWGFGLRYALVSGHLAANALLGGRPSRYDRMWRRRFAGMMRTAMVNRWLLSGFGDRAYAFLLSKLERAPDACECLRRLYAPSGWKLLCYPAARRRAFPRPSGTQRRSPQVRTGTTQ